MDKKNISEQSEDVLQAKKKLAMFIAGGVTFIIFCLWIVYFLNTTSKINPDSKGGFGSFIGDIQKNAGESFSQIQNVTGELNQKIKSVGDYYAGGQASTTATSTTESTSIENNN